MKKTDGFILKRPSEWRNKADTDEKREKSKNKYNANIRFNKNLSQTKKRRINERQKKD